MENTEFPNGIESFNELENRIMNENINLCELLKGHEGETFYSPLFGYIKLCKIDKSCDFPIILSNDKRSDIHFTENGKYFKYYDNSECLLFPSKNQRDWNKWAEEQKPKVSKTWRDIVNNREVKHYHVNTYEIEASGLRKLTPIEKSALALLKIHQLIEVGYGGNLTNEEWKNNWHSTIRVDVEGKLFIESTYNSTVFPIVFHTKEQAEEFLSHPENVQLIKDFYIIHNF